ncbi:MAG: hypothetical protein A2270_11720 [Elusimicrobia bacterium RIFOXYA12_FULL_51_18]|nr:MAG: hypothetical protein A2270_11720 [Elusimicrobia bacterium RIFOXYA12_FULL_51_18]OGS28833.1 MAG: hypothetical protein A2218_09180 [Elusimicrobia bacterium RIFOXYA2_FULL_53_38]
MLKVGLIGAGFIGNLHANDWQAVKGAKLVTVADISHDKAKRLAGKFNLRWTDNGEAVVGDDEIDIVDVCLPTMLHKEYVLKAAKNKKHVFCEKPIARNLADAGSMVQACKKANVKLMIGHVVRFFHEFVKIKEQIEGGAVGRVGVVRTSRCVGFPRFSPESTAWYSDFDKSGGVALDLIAHDFDWLRWCFGEVERVYGRGLAHKLKDHIDYALVTLRFKNGVIAHTEGSWAEPGGFKTAVEIAGDKGLIDFKSDEAKPIHAWMKRAEGGNSAPETAAPILTSPYTLELQEFVNSIVENRAPSPSPEDSIKSLKVALAALESIKTGEVITL